MTRPADGLWTCPAGRHRRRYRFVDSGGPCAPCAFELAKDQVTDVLAGLLPDRGELVAQVVAKVATSGEKTRTLLAWLTEDADPLRRGASDTPVAAQVLLRTLQDAGVAVVLPRCAACGQHRRHVVSRADAGRVCMTCYQSQGAEPCGQCGRTGVVSTRDGQGRAICPACRAGDQARWRPCGVCGKTSAPVAVERGIRLGSCCYVPLSQRCTVCGLTKAVLRQSGRRSVCRECREIPVVDCASCGLDAPAPPISHHVPTLLDPGSETVGEKVGGLGASTSPNPAGGVLCARCRGGRAVPCTECGTATVARTRRGEARCPDCYRRPVGTCGRCGRERPIARLAVGADPDLCAACWRGPVGECAACGQRRPCRGERAGVMLCQSCSTGRPLPCSICGRTRRVTAHWPDGPVCPSCYVYARSLQGTCPGCGQLTRLLRRTRAAPACPACLGIPDHGRCVNCGTVQDRRPMRGRCTRCAVAVRLRDLLSGGQEDGAPAVPALEGLRAVLGEAPSQAGVLDWLTRRASAGRVLLERLASGQIDCSHDGLDAQEQTVALIRVRHLLVAAGALPERDPVLAATITWSDRFLSGLQDPVQAQSLRCYLRWKLLPRLRESAAKAPLPASTGYSVRARLSEAARFLAFLGDRGRALDGCRQQDLEAWAVAQPTTMTSLPSYWTWAARRGDMPRLRHPRPQPSGGPAAAPGRDERWALARALLHDDGITTSDRVAGCLVLIYGQRPGAVTRMSIDDVLLAPASPTDPPEAAPTADGQPVRIRLGATAIEVPDPLAGHLRALLAEHRGPTTAAVTSQWLFPSPSAPGQPVGPQTLSKRLARLGLAPETHRIAALMDLAAQMPPRVLADVLGVSQSTAEHWAAMAGRDRAAYLHLA